MSTKNDIITSYYSLKPSQYGYLETFKLYRVISKEGCSDFHLELKMSSTSNFDDKKRLHLSFSGIKELKLGNLEGLLSLLIDIMNIQEYQLEGAKYKVIEREYEAFSFFMLRY